MSTALRALTTRVLPKALGSAARLAAAAAAAAVARCTPRRTVARAFAAAAAAPPVVHTRLSPLLIAPAAHMASLPSGSPISSSSSTPRYVRPLTHRDTLRDINFFEPASPPTRGLPEAPAQVLSRDILRRLPKAELHAHLDGCCRVETILELAREQAVKLPTDDLPALEKLLHVPLDCQSLEEYLNCFAITLSVLQKEYALTRVFYEMCEDAVKDGVRYLEVRFSPILHTREGLSLSQVMEAVCEGLVMAEYHLPITARIIVCGMRHMHSDVTSALAQLAWRFKLKGVVAFDLAGAENGFSSKHHKSAIDLIHANFLNVTLHSGEGAGWESIHDSIFYCGAHRLGHGTRLYENEKLKQFVIDRRIPLEVCVTSNVQTKAVASFETHPMRQYFDDGVIVVPCTDNRLMSNTTLTDEYHLIMERYNFSVPELVRLIDYGFSSAFLEEPQRSRLRAEALRSCVEQLTRAGIDMSPVKSDFSTYFLAGVHFDDDGAYWGNFSNPDLSEELLRVIPKADLHCRFDCYISGVTLYNLLVRENFAFSKLFGEPVDTREDFFRHLSTLEFRDEKYRVLTERALQRPENVELVLEELFQHASDDGVSYLELLVRPMMFSDKRLFDTILQKATELRRRHNIQGGIVVYVRIGDDDPIQVWQSAQLAVEARDRGVLGFAVHGQEMQASDFRHYNTTWDYLKSNELPVCIRCGDKIMENVNPALRIGGATRLSGCRALHMEPRVINYLTNHDVPVEVPHKMYDIPGPFRDSLLRVLFDMGVKITFGSVPVHTVSPMLESRNKRLLEVMRHFTIADTLKILSNGFLHNFSPYHRRRDMCVQFLTTSRELLEQRGFRYFHKKTFFVDHIGKTRAAVWRDGDRDAPAMPFELRRMDSKSSIDSDQQQWA